MASTAGFRWTQNFSSQIEDINHFFYTKFNTFTRQLNTIDSNNKNLKLRGFGLNSSLTPMIIGASSNVSSKSVPKNELISLKLALEYMYLISLNLSVRSESKYVPLHLTILGDSLCAAALFIFENTKKSMLQSSIYNVSQDLMTKILQLLPKAFMNLSFV